MAVQPPSIYGGRTPQPGRLPQPGNPAAPIAEGLEAIGTAAMRAQDQHINSQQRIAEMDLQTNRVARDRDLNRATADRARALAESHGQLLVDLANMRAEAGPGAEGYEARVDERIGKWRDEFMGSLGNDPELVERFADNVAALGASARVDETRFAVTERAKKGVSDFTTLQSTLANSMQTRAAAGTLTDADLATAEGLLNTGADAQPATGNVRDKLKYDGKVQLHYSAALGAMQVNPQGVLDQVDKGRFDWMPEATRNQLRDRADMLVRRAEAEARSAANEAVQISRAQSRVMIEQVGEGVAVDGEALKSALAVAQASKEPEDIALAHDLSVALARNLTTTTYDNSSIAERQAAIREIEGSKDWQKDERLVAAHTQLGVLNQRDSRAARADPLTLFVRQSGSQVGAADLNNRASMAGRFTYGDRVAERYPGTPPTHLFEAEAQQLRDQWNTGTPAARADFVQTLGSYGPQRGRELMRQLAPNKPEYGRLVELGSFRDPVIKGYVREALDGWAQPPSKAVDSGRMSAAANSRFGDTLAKIPGDRRAAIMQVATGIYSHRAAQGSVTSYDPDLWSQSLEAALGGNGAGRGGFGKAGNGEAMILPASMSQQDFDTLINVATPKERGQAAGNQPALWGDGKPISTADLRRMTPVLVRDDGQAARYAFRARGGGYARRADGGDWIIDVRALARIMAPRVTP